MKKRKILYIALIHIIMVLLVFIFYTKIYDKNEKIIRDTVETYLNLCIDGKSKEAIKCIYFIDELKELYPMMEESLKTSPYYYYKFKKIKRYNDKVYRCKYLVNDGNDEDFMPYVANINNKWYIVLNKDNLPRELITSNIPDDIKGEDYIDPKDVLGITS